jgi:hypothetical protein
LATTFYLSKITSYCCQSTAQVRYIVIRELATTKKDWRFFWLRYFWSQSNPWLPMQSVPITTIVWVQIPLMPRCTHTTLCEKVCQ